MQFTLSLYDKDAKCMVCGAHASEHHTDGCEVGALIKDLDHYRKILEFHPRAAKLMKKKKSFIVIAVDEPYFEEAYTLIRANEIDKKTWWKMDEEMYDQLISESRAQANIQHNK